MFLLQAWQIVNCWSRAETLRNLAGPRYADYAALFGFEEGAYPTEGGLRYFLFVKRSWWTRLSVAWPRARSVVSDDGGSLCKVNDRTAQHSAIRVVRLGEELFGRWNGRLMGRLLEGWQDQQAQDGIEDQARQEQDAKATRKCKSRSHEPQGPDLGGIVFRSLSGPGVTVHSSPRFR